MSYNLQINEGQATLLVAHYKNEIAMIDENIKTLKSQKEEIYGILTQLADRGMPKHANNNSLNLSKIKELIDGEYNDSWTNVRKMIYVLKDKQPLTSRQIADEIFMIENKETKGKTFDDYAKSLASILSIEVKKEKNFISEKNERNVNVFRIKK